MMLQRLRRLLQKKAVVLMYHRIAEPATDPWLLAVSPARFEQHLQVLCHQYRVISIEELIRQHAQGSIASRNVCLTFDDGYSDNYLFAKPLLEKYGCPAAFFLPTHYIGSNKPFWWDELDQLLLRTEQLPDRFDQIIYNQPVQVELEGEALLTPELWRQHTAWSAYNPPPTRRAALYYTLWKLIRPLPYPEAAAMMEQIRQWAGTAMPSGKPAVPITVQQLHEMHAQSLFHIGLHTVTHPDLASHPEADQRREITESIRYFQHHLRQPLRTLAYPYGRYNDATLSIAKELGLSAAFTTFDEPVTERADRYQLGRFQVQNWNGKEFEQHLQRWSKTWFSR